MTPEQFSALPAGDLVLTAPMSISLEAGERLRAYVERYLPGRTVLILSDGLSIAPVDNMQALQRIEAKLDTMIAALAEDDDEPTEDLSGRSIHQARESRSL